MIVFGGLVNSVFETRMPKFISDAFRYGKTLRLVQNYIWHDVEAFKLKKHSAMHFTAKCYTVFNFTGVKEATSWFDG